MKYDLDQMPAEFTFSSGVTLPTGVRFECTAYVPVDQDHEDVMETLDLVEGAIVRAAFAYRRAEAARIKASEVPF